MAWMNALYKTYENNLSKVGYDDGSGIVLAPVSHINANAQVEITINIDGDFISASEIDKNSLERKTIIPVTVPSGSRANAIAPHALCDMLPYIAGDYADYEADSKAAKKAADKFAAYIIQLRKWADSDFSHPKVNAILAYVEKCSVISDLVKLGIVKLDASSKLSNGKIQGTPYEKAITRFRVICESFSDVPTGTWEDKTLFDAYVSYYIPNMMENSGLCYVSGQNEPLATLHPKGIIASAYGAKLVSANDTTNFTFRGRFETYEEAVSVGYKSSQYAHLALSWLVAKQGLNISGRMFVCWNPDGKKTPNFKNDPFAFEDEEIVADTEEIFKKKLYKAFAGYWHELDDNDGICIIVLDAATTGRLSITYYNELRASDFLSRLENWSETCKWFFPHYNAEKKFSPEIQTPNTKRIVERAFGLESGDFISCNDKVMKEQYQRIFHCIVDKKPIPRDIVNAIVQKASNPQCYKKHYNYENVLSTACALIAKYHNDKNEEKVRKGLLDRETYENEVKIKMGLDKENCDRSYLFGRLLAVAEYVERSALGFTDERETNAMRLQSVFVHYPLRTFTKLNLNLEAYYKRLTPLKRKYLRDLTQEIVNKFVDKSDEKLNRSLSDLYLIGYNNQRAELNNKNIKQEA